MGTYSSPIANRSTIATFFLVAMLSFQTALAGRTRIKISETTLKEQVTRTMVYAVNMREWMHLASSMSGFQSASRGEQAKIVMPVLIV